VAALVTVAPTPVVLLVAVAALAVAAVVWAAASTSGQRVLHAASARS
jgi:autotransporter translocation and assembly factor TamB